MASILIVEDERLIAAEITRALRRLGHDPLPFVTNSEAALEAVASSSPDMVLMDVNINGDTDGIATALLIQRQFGVPVVFLTAQSDAKTIDRAKLARSYGYILKPFTDDSLRAQLEIALYEAQQGNRPAPPPVPTDTAELPAGPVRFFFLRKGAGYVRVRVEDILYLEAVENNVRVSTTQGQFIVFTTLREMEQRLTDPPFFRVHRAHIVNLDQVQGYEEGCVLFNRTEVVPVSRSCKEALKRRLNLM